MKLKGLNFIFTRGRRGFVLQRIWIGIDPSRLVCGSCDIIASQGIVGGGGGNDGEPIPVPDRAPVRALA